MDFPVPRTDMFTIYSKSGCANCNKVKLLLKENNIAFHVIHCDDYLVDHREEFMKFMISLTGITKGNIVFPQVFHPEFIGGYNETVTYVDNRKVQLLLEFDAPF